ncbi:hypothetical protein CWC11_13295 [Pseudoalteromonas sp. S3178]|uniref:LysR family transcriptional regulator n=1 Tax=Pseudoalteromonas sp. S3178 TaxID=579532 RepID=UPI00110BC328|nr:LysR family transcriptional regulator [Pseudoalteromonas sp. S3178]TMP03656.1 hypothetical protein CWC11_13295 [Pseudoalteromonas sp. S3178]
MKFDDMALFLLVAELGSFTKTAEYKNMPKSTVSRHVKDLEDSLGVRLLDRTTRTLKLTAQGELFYQRAKKILQDIDKVRDDIGEEQSTAAGDITMYAPSILFHLFGKWIMQFREQYPDIHLELLNLDSNTRFPEQARFDLILQPGVVNDSSFISRKIADTKGQYYASPEYIRKMGAPNEPNDLTQHHIVFYSLHHGEVPRWQFHGSNEPYFVDFKRQINSNSVETTLSLALEGAGVVRLPLMLSKPYVESGQLCELFNGAHKMNVPLYAIYPSRRYMPERVRLILQFLLDNAQSAIDELS